MSIIIFIIILAVLVLVHEFGHFIVAKKSGIRVDEFGLGFPPKIISKKWRGTLYTLNAIPFGGFVKIFGEDSHSEDIKSQADRDVSFVYKSKWIQAAVLVAGVTMNVIFAWLVISTSFLFGVPATSDYGGFGKVSNNKLVITEVLPNSPANKSGLITGDEVSKISSGSDVLTKDSLTPSKAVEFISSHSDKEITIGFVRNKETGEQSATLKAEENIVKGKKVVGIGMESVGILKLPIHLALLEGVRTTWIIIKNTAIGLYTFISGIFTFKSDFSQVSGPVGIAKVVGEARAHGFVYLLTLTALISINLAIINLLPFPALDGGRLLFVLIEAIIRRPINPKVVQWTNTLGFIFLILLMLAVTTHDIIKLF